MRGPAGGLEYPDASVQSLEPGTATAPRAQVGPASRHFAVAVQAHGGDWELIWHYEMRQQAPALSVRLEVRPLRAGAILRNLRVRITATVEDARHWRVQAPGNKLRADLPLLELSYPTTVNTVAGVEGSSGLIALERVGSPVTLLIWPLDPAHYGELVLQPAIGGISVDWTADVAGAPPVGGSLTAGPLHLDLLGSPFAEVLATVPSMLADAGIAPQGPPPAWAAAVNLYEVQIGFGVFRGGFTYEPYPSVEALLDDLDRIAALGYNCLQIMPRQPYPSYNVHDFDDVTTSWGDEQALRRVIQACHERGMRVIFDILMHGVIDHEALDATLAAIDAGPFGDRLGESTVDITTLERDELDHITISWTRHVLDFEPYWRGGSPPRHPLVDQHPDWFTRDSQGSITGMYTQAFDLANPQFQDYFVDKAISLMQRMGIDGFRLDAPSYNYFMNWSERTRSNASVSMLGCLALFAKLRTAAKAVDPDCLLYTEPSGALYRASMDVVYNYDEQWLIRAVLEAGSGKAHWIRNARELGQWISQRDAALPAGSLTAHHIDSHDSYWWPDPGSKWRREQYGTAATAALMYTFFLSGGPFMTYVGGEVGIEEAVRSAATLRSTHPFFADGRSDYRGVEASSDDVYAVLRISDEGCGLLLVNLSPRAVQAEVAVHGDAKPGSSTAMPSLLGDGSLHWHALPSGNWQASLEFAPFEAAAFDLTGMG